MRLNLIQLKRIEKDVYKPILLDDSYKIGLEIILGYLLENIGKNYEEILDNLPENIFPSLKYETIIRDFLFSKCFKPSSALSRNMPNMPDLLSLPKLNSDKKNSPSQQPSISFPISELRLNLFKIVNEQYGGFIPPDDPRRYDVLKQLLKKFNSKLNNFGIHLNLNEKRDLQKLENMIFSDHETNLILTIEDDLIQSYYKNEFRKDLETNKISENIIDILIERINFLIFWEILRNSKELIITINKPLKASEYKKINYIISRSGFFVDFRKKKISQLVLLQDYSQIEDIVVRISLGDLILKPTPKQMHRFASASFFTLKKLANYCQDSNPPIITLEYRKRDIKIVMGDLINIIKRTTQKKQEVLLESDAENEDLGIQKENNNDENSRPITTIPMEKFQEIGFDSAVEAEFFRKLSAKTELFAKIRRNADIIIAKDSVILPDFQLEYHNNFLFIEIVGFWTTSYKNKKIEKLTKLKKTGFDPSNLLLFVDKSLNFPDLGYPMFLYTARTLNTSEILKYILKWQNKIYTEFISKIKESILDIIREEIKKQDEFETEHFVKLFNLCKNAEWKSIFNDLRDELKLNDYLIKISKNKWITPKKLKYYLSFIDDLIKVKRKYSKTEIIEKLKNEIPLNYIDFLVKERKGKIKYQNLGEIYIIFPE
ncbi:MAG: DUF790 family protein [Promethearchaeota archaeon]